MFQSFVPLVVLGALSSISMSCLNWGCQNRMLYSASRCRSAKCRIESNHSFPNYIVIYAPKNLTNPFRHKVVPGVSIVTVQLMIDHVNVLLEGTAFQGRNLPFVNAAPCLLQNTDSLCSVMKWLACHHVWSLSYLLFLLSIHFLLFQIVAEEVTRGCDLPPEAPLRSTVMILHWQGKARQHLALC